MPRCTCKELGMITLSLKRKSWTIWRSTTFPGPIREPRLQEKPSPHNPER